ncbi:MAG: hypothetical protein ACXVXP_13800, partial [Mycobacteriaceae bacterium]
MAPGSLTLGREEPPVITLDQLLLLGTRASFAHRLLRARDLGERADAFTFGQELLLGGVHQAV